LLNAAAGSCFTVRVAAPIAAGVFYGVGPSVPLRAIAAGVIFWTIAARAALARRLTLGKLTWAQALGWIVWPTAVALVCGVGGLLYARYLDRHR